MTSPPIESPPPPKPGQFFLKTEALPGAPAGQFSGLYLRQYSAANPAVVLTPTAPKFLRANVADVAAGAGVEFTSWAPRHAGRKWSLVLGNSDSEALWETVGIVEDKADKGLRFVPTTPTGDVGEVEHGGKEDKGDKDLRIRTVSTPNKPGADEGGPEAELRGCQGWKGWMVCEWSLGHPQLFWVTEHMGDRELPVCCERVRLVRSAIV